jgi:hypothetical protein
MQNPQPIQFLLHRLTTNEQDRDRFNLTSDVKIVSRYIDSRTDQNYKKYVFEFKDKLIGNIKFSEFQKLPEIYQIAIIRTCLSRVNGEAVLGVFEKTRAVKSFDGEIIKYQDYTEVLYFSFNHSLYNGKPLDESIQSLHEKMLELVPEYVEFLKK